jgi:hypothetical protein
MTKRILCMVFFIGLVTSLFLPLDRYGILTSRLEAAPSKNGDKKLNATGKKNSGKKTAVAKVNKPKVAKKPSAKKPSAKKTGDKKTSAKKPSAKKPSAKKPSAKKTGDKKTSAKKTSAKKTGAKEKNSTKKQTTKSKNQSGMNHKKKVDSGRKTVRNNTFKNVNNRKLVYNRNSPNGFIRGYGYRRPYYGNGYRYGAGYSSYYRGANPRSSSYVDLRSTKNYTKVMPSIKQTSSRGVGTKPAPKPTKIMNVAGKWELIIEQNMTIELKTLGVNANKGKVVSNNNEIGEWELNAKGVLLLLVFGVDIGGTYMLEEVGVSPLSFAGNWTNANGTTKAVEMNFLSKR